MKRQNSLFRISALLCGMLSACGGVSAREVPERRDEAPAAQQAGGNSAQGGASQGSAGSAGSAGKPSHPSPTPSVPKHEYFVAPKLGKDENPGTRQAPLKTIAKASAVARAGDAIVLLDGTYNAESEPALGSSDVALEIPDGVSVRAATPGSALVEAQTSQAKGFTFLGSGELKGVALRGFSNAIRAKSGDLVFEALKFDAAGASNCAGDFSSAVIQLSGTARVRWLPGAVENPIGEGISCLVDLDESAELLVEGGRFSDSVEAGSPELSALFVARGKSLLTFENVAFTNNFQQLIGGRGSAQIRLQKQSSLTSPETPKDKQRPFIVLLETPLLSVSGNVKFDAKQPCISVYVLSELQKTKARLELTDVSMTGCSVGIRTHGLECAQISLKNVSISQGGYGVLLAYGGILDADNVVVSDNRGVGIQLGGATLWRSQARLRNVTIERNLSAGLSLQGNAQSHYDLGRGNDPGNNVFRKNGYNTQWNEQHANLQGGPDGSAIVYAAGNTWDPSIQGADEHGHYHVPDSANVLASEKSSDGLNYRTSAGKVRLAERACVVTGECQ